MMVDYCERMALAVGKIERLSTAGGTPAIKIPGSGSVTGWG